AVARLAPLRQVDQLGDRIAARQRWSRRRIEPHAPLQLADVGAEPHDVGARAQELAVVLALDDAAAGGEDEERPAVEDFSARSRFALAKARFAELEQHVARARAGPALAERADDLVVEIDERRAQFSGERAADARLAGAAQTDERDRQLVGNRAHRNACSNAV